MKTTIITLAIAAIMTLANINYAWSKQKTYTNNTSEGNIKTTIAYVGENDKNLKPIKKWIIEFDENGSNIQKIVYKWNNKEWECIAKYNYSYREDKQVESLSYTQWDTNYNKWEDNATKIQYIQNLDNEFQANNN